MEDLTLAKNIRLGLLFVPVSHFLPTLTFVKVAHINKETSLMFESLVEVLSAVTIRLGWR